MPRRYSLFGIIAVITLVLDQVTKYWARETLTSLGYKGQEVIAGYFDFRLSFNTGSAFGLFADMGGARIFLSIVGVGALIALLFMLRKTQDRQTWLIVALALVSGGAIGNVVDRIMAGKVTDFIVWKIGSSEWPSFNIADSALCIGVALMFLDAGREAKAEKAAQARKPETPPSATA